MKKIYSLLIMLTIINLSYAQEKETALTTIGSMKVKINLHKGNSTATITLIGPSNKWLSVGFNTTSMTSNTDCFTYGTSLLDQFLPGGHSAAITDPTQNLTLVSNVVVGTTRTVVATRPFSTSDSKDFTFNYASNSINIIYAVGPSTNVSSQHSTFGSKTLTFTTLGTEDFASLDKISISPNPSNGIFNITKNNAIQISKIRVFDTNAKLLKEINTNLDNPINAVDLSELSKGMYFIEISNKEDKTVKKIVLK
ncbi:T9SS type A sorting domain-containing protein [Flavobacterium psychrotolerans]|uniref:DOMON domain-containing protein n=1 Tax=Flavobacterium psychrotolerans TaxID=2169410 RepID=A0A2U1JQS8_9FLAO|nr:T9SS type A sorting domain-containing protein [Flavobacterium psychrotolerans]PWA07243.1 hypothetical protein DB895_00530 [Flavobacterium psychrotolerans]